MVVYEKNKPLVKRVPTITDTTEKILRCDSDNLYQQRMEQLLRDSPTLLSVKSRVADFVNGEGFADPNIGNLIVNRKGLKGETLNRVLKNVSLDYVNWSSVAFHIGYNLNGSICAINPLPFKTIRFGLRDPLTKKIMKYAYSANWERDGKSSNEKNITFYHRFNPDPAVVLQQMQECKGIQNYKGQILYLTPVDDEYPLATFDAVSNDAQVQAEIGMFKVGNTQNSFLATLAVLYPGEFGSAEEEQNFRDLIANKSGSRNAGSRIGLQDKTGQRKASDMFQVLTPANLDKLYEYTEKSVKDNIIEHEAFPQILLGKSPNGLFAQGDMEEAYTYANAMTRNRRSELSEVFALLLSYWETPIQTDASIKEQRYIVEGDNTGLQVNDNLKNMTGMQAIQFARILRNYEKGKANRQVSETLLRGGFGLSEDEIRKLLDGIDSAKAEDPGMQAMFKKMALAFKKYFK